MNGVAGCFLFVSPVEAVPCYLTYTAMHVLLISKSSRVMQSKSLPPANPPNRLIHCHSLRYHVLFMTPYDVFSPALTTKAMVVQPCGAVWHRLLHDAAERSSLILNIAG